MPGQHKATRWVGTIVAAAALLVGACSTDREITTPEPKPVTDARLNDALVTVEDLPDAYAAANQGTSISAEVVPEHECDDAIADLEPKNEATADFTAGTVRLTSTVAWFPGGGAAVEQRYRDVAEDCAAVVVTDKGVSLITSRLRFGVLSDDTFPLKFEFELADGTIEERDLIVMRAGDLVGVVRLTGPRPSDKVLLDSVVRTAIGRLAFLSDETS